MLTCATRRNKMREKEDGEHSRSLKEGERTSEEEDLLQRTVKKVKRIHREDGSHNRLPTSQITSMPASSERKTVSYKDLLLGQIPGAYHQAFFNNESDLMDAMSDTKDDDEPISDYEVKVVLSKDIRE